MPADVLGYVPFHELPVRLQAKALANLPRSRYAWAQHDKSGLLVHLPDCALFGYLSPRDRDPVGNHPLLDVPDPYAQGESP